MKLPRSLILCFLFIYSCGSEQPKQNVYDEVSLAPSKLDKIFVKKDEAKKPSSGKAKADIEKEKVLYPSIEDASIFPTLEVNASYSSAYDLPMEQMIERLWDLANTCKNCKYNMPSLVQAREFVVSEKEKIVWHAVEKKLWLFSFKSSTFLSAKQYRSEDGKEFILDLVTFDSETAKQLEKRTGLKFKATFKKLMYRFKLKKRGESVDSTFLAAGTTGGLSSRVPHNILEKELKNSLEVFVKAYY